MYLTNIFGEVPERNITFVIDTSGSMYDVLNFIKDHIVETLIDRAYNRPGTTFNIIEFSSEITQWADCMVECTPATVNAATRWLRGIESKTGSDTLTALEMAFDEPRCDAVYLVSDGMPDQEPTDIVRRTRRSSQGRPVHCISVSDRSQDLPPASRLFLEDLSVETRGSFHLVNVTRMGDVRKVVPVYNSRLTPIEGDKKCSVSTSLLKNPYVEALETLPSAFPPYSANYRYYPFLHTEALKEELERTPVASIVARGTRILARRDEDGYYYRAHIAQEVSGNRNKFLIEFDRTRKGRDLRMQETSLHDIITLNDAIRHSVVVGDKVLAPWEGDGKRFGPGKVIGGVEKRHTIGDDRDSDVTVAFWNGKTATINKGVAIWIPELLYDRIVVELQMPITARKEIIDRGDACELPHGYPSLPRDIDDVVNAGFNSLVTVRRHLLYYPFLHRGLYYLPTYPLLTPVPSLLRSWPDLIHHRPDLLYGSWPWPYYPENVLPYRRRYPITQPQLEGSELTGDELNDKVDRQLSKYNLLPSRKERFYSDSSSSSSCSDSEEEIGELAVANYPLTVDAATNTKSFHKRATERPRWKKYWPQTPQPRLHHSPDFHKRAPGMYSTWDGLDDPTNHSSLYHPVDGKLGVRSDRNKLMQHLKTPYVEIPEYATYKAQLGSNDLPAQINKDRLQNLHRREALLRSRGWANKEDHAWMKTRNVEDNRRQQTLARINCDVEKQREYERRLESTIDAKAKINQGFRNSFFQKELDNMNRQQTHADWLQARRNHFMKEHNAKSLQREQVQDNRLIGRQHRQARHHDLTVRKALVEDARLSAMTLGGY